MTKLNNNITWSDIDKYARFSTLVIAITLAYFGHDNRLSNIEGKLVRTELVAKHAEQDLIKALADAKVVNRLENLEVVIFGEVKTADRSANLK